MAKRIHEQININEDCYLGDPWKRQDGQLEICIDGYLTLQELEKLVAYLKGLG